MMSLQTPGITIREVEVAQPRQLRMDVLGIVGQAARGPLNYPQLLTSWGQFGDIFGDFVGFSYLAYAVFGFFLNGGQRCYVVRVAHETASCATLVLPAGTSTTLTAALAAGATEAQLASTKLIQPGMHLVISDGTTSVQVVALQVDQSDTIMFRNRVQDASGNPLDIPPIQSNASVMPVALYVQAINAGGWGNDLSVTVEPASTGEFVLTHLATDIASNQNRVKVQSVAGLAGVDLATGRSGDAVTLIHPRDPVREKVTIQMINVATNELTFSNAVTRSFPAGSGVLGRGFTLNVRLMSQGQVVREEVFDNLALNPGNERYAVDVVNGDPEEADYVVRMQNGNSVLIRISDPNRLAGVASSRPQALTAQTLHGGADGPHNFGIPGHQYYTGYDNGTYFRPVPLGATLAQRKAIAETRCGLAAFEVVSAIGLVAIPDLIIPLLYQIVPATRIPQPGIIFAPASIDIATAAGIQDVRDGQSDMLRHCAQQGDRFAILDAPYGLEVGKGTNRIEDWPGAFQLSPDAKYGALYYPWIKEKLLDFGGRNLFIPPSGHVAGIYARSDAARGVGKAPANEVVQGIIEPAYCLDDADQAMLNPCGVNCLRVFPGRGILVWGGRTLSLDPRWRYVNTRRVALAIIKHILLNLQWAVFEPNDRRLWKRIIASLTLFFRDLFQRGALVGNRAEEAFFVKCDEETNPPDVVDRGEVIVRIGFAPARPAEFILVTIKRTTESVSVSE